MATLLLGKDLIHKHDSIFDFLSYTGDVTSIKENIFISFLSRDKAKTEYNLNSTGKKGVVDSEGNAIFCGNVITVSTGVNNISVYFRIKEFHVDSDNEMRWIAVLEPISTIVSKAKIITKESLLQNSNEEVEVSDKAVIDDNLTNYISSVKFDDIMDENYVCHPCFASTIDVRRLPFCVTTMSPLINHAESRQDQYYDVKFLLLSSVRGRIVVDEKEIIQQNNHNIPRPLFRYDSIELEGQTCFLVNMSLLTSTSAVFEENEKLNVQEGSYVTTAKHADGSSTAIIYQTRRVIYNEEGQIRLWVILKQRNSIIDESHQRPELSPTSIQKKISGRAIFKSSNENSPVEENLDNRISDVNISECSGRKYKSESSLNEESENEESTRSMTRTDGSSANEYSLSQSFAECRPRSFSENDMLISCKNERCAENCTFEDPEWLLTNGKYSDHYAVMKQIGKGAFGYVRLSYRKHDGLIVVTKFIKKSQVYNDSWIETPKTCQKVCLEVDLLMRLNHPNIVKGLEYFENDKYFQLVMEKWGSGMDLFEFIERDPALDEPLISYLFRQIVSPLLYLNSLNIIHRDIKDENIIINERFHIKLIDFGSAAYLEEDKKFAQFAGTIEYCSPEVLSGKKYSGPELEVWSLGITLYTIICGENPFNTVYEVLNSEFTFSSNYSEGLFCLLSGMLKKNPKERMNLEQISSHKWTNQKVNLEMYSFEDIIPCSSVELSPPKYITEVKGFEQGFSSTPRGFMFENRQTHSAKESSVTIDSAVFWDSRNTARRTISCSSDSDITNTSNGKTPSATSNELKSSYFCPWNENDDLDRTLSFSSLNDNSRSSSRTSPCSDLFGTRKSIDESNSSSSDDIDEVFSMCSSSSEISSSNSNSSFTSEGTVSVDSGSDEHTLESICINNLIFDKENE